MKINNQPLRSLVLGGMKSGKSAFAAQLAEQHVGAAKTHVVFVATATALDDEMSERIELHKVDRDPNWTVIEEPLSLAATIENIARKAKESDDDICIVIDCLTLWVTNLLVNDNEPQLKREVADFTRAVVSCPVRLIMVSNETNMGITPMGELSRKFCDETGLLHQQLARHCEQVVLMVAGLAVTVK